MYGVLHARLRLPSVNEDSRNTPRFLEVQIRMTVCNYGSDQLLNGDEEVCDFLHRQGLWCYFVASNTDFITIFVSHNGTLPG